MNDVYHKAESGNLSETTGSNHKTAKVTVIIPTKNAGQFIDGLLSALLRQTVSAEIIIIDSGSSDHTPDIVEKYSPEVKLIRIPASSFDHGGTRDCAFRQSSGDFVLFLTQDALPADDHYIENMLQPFSDGNVAGVRGRHIAWEDAPEYEKLTREFNYPPESRVWNGRNIEKYGVKSYFFSNVCSAYRRSAYEAVGGFDSPVPANEDMLIAAKLIQAGYSLAYNSEAVVYHSHHFTLRQEYLRNTRIGYTMEQYRQRLPDAKTGFEGLKLAKYVMAGLLQRKKYMELPYFSLMLVAKLSGFLTGKIKYRKSAG